MEKLKKDLFLDNRIEEKTLYAGARPCATMLGGTVTYCCSGGGCFMDVGQ